MAMYELDDRSVVSPRLVAAALAFTGWVLGFVSEFAGITGFATYAVVLALLGASALWVIKRHVSIGRWFTLFVAVAGVHLGYHWLGVPGFLVLTPLTVALAGTMNRLLYWDWSWKPVPEFIYHRISYATCGSASTSEKV